MDEVRLIHSSTSLTPEWNARATTYTSMRLHVDNTAASSMWGKEVSSSMARGHSACV